MTAVTLKEAAPCLASKLALAEADASRFAAALEALGAEAPELAAAEAECIRAELQALRRRVRILTRSVANRDACLGDSGIA